MLVSVSYKIRNYVFEEIEHFPSTGTYANSQIVSGFSFDRIKVPAPIQQNNSIKTSIGGVAYNLEEGSSNKHWDGGVVSGCELNEIVIEPDKIYPEIQTGSYTLFDKTKMFYSSSSSCGMVFDISDGYSYTLPKNAKTETLDVCLYKRDDNFNNIPWVRYELNDTAKYKYSLNSLNDINEVSISEGFYNPGTWKENLSSNNIDELEYQYKGTGSYRIIYSKYFPIDETSVELYSININDDSLNQWTKVDNFLTSTFQDKHYILFPEKGMIITSGCAISSTKTFKYKPYIDSYSCYVYEDISDFPNQGIIVIDSIEYRYNGKSEHYLYQIEHIDPAEDYQAFTNSDSFFLKSLGQNTSLNEKFYLNYKVGARIDFETKEEDTRKDFKLNLKPKYMNRSNGILQIFPNEINVSKIELSSSGNTLHLGVDYLSLAATAYTSNDAKVYDLPIQFNVLDEDAKLLFEGDSLSITKLTNVLGRANTTLTAPYDDSILCCLSNLVIENKKIVINDFKFNYEDITVYAILRYNGIEKISDPSFYEQERLNTNDYLPALVERLLYVENPDNPNYYKPLNAASYNNRALVFDSTILTCWDRVSNPDSLIYKYKIYFTRKIKVQASCVDPATGLKILSNKIEIKVKLPIHMQGYDLSKAYVDGFQIKSNDIEIATGLGGANYITINPEMISTMSLRIK